MNIIREIKEVIGLVVKQMLLIGAIIVGASIAPVIIVVLPQVLILQYPQGNFSMLAQLYFWATPVAVSMWMAFLCNWSSIRLWKQSGEGNVSEWREANGGFLRVNMKSTGFMMLGGFGSFVCEFAFLIAFGHVHSTAQYRLWFALFPFVAFAPVILLQVKRYYSGEHYDKVTGKFYNNYWSEAARMKSPYLYKTHADIREERIVPDPKLIAAQRAKYQAILLAEAAPAASEEELLTRIDGHIAQRHS